jgi:hypothetical protein
LTWQKRGFGPVSPYAESSGTRYTASERNDGKRGECRPAPFFSSLLMKHEFIELGPLTPLHLLLTDGGARNEIMTIGDMIGDL